MPDATALRPVGEAADLDRMALLIDDTERGVLLLAVYESVPGRDRLVAALKARLHLPVVESHLSVSNPNPLHLLREHARQPRTCFFFHDLEAALPNVTGYLNLQRETLAEVPHAVVFWVLPHGLEQLAQRAPDFWSWRSGVFYFHEAAPLMEAERIAQEIVLERPWVMRREEAERRIRLYEDILAEQPVPARLDDHVLSTVRLKLAELYAQQGRYEQAATLSEALVADYRVLVERNRDAFLPDLASALNNLGIRQSNVGRRVEALEATGEAVRLYQSLVAVNQDAFLPSLAAALNNLGDDLLNMGRREEALTVTGDAVGYYKELVEGNRDAFLPDLARALTNLGRNLSEMGRREDALEVTGDAVGYYKELVKRNRDAFLPDLASALNNLGMIQLDMGGRADAISVTGEAVGYFKELVKRNRDAFLSDLAWVLGAHGTAVQMEGDYAAAIPHFAEGIALLTPLFVQLPQAFGDLMRRLGAAYREACQQAGQEPDAALLEPLQPYLGQAVQPE